jgi:alpha-tubulin suppressor-like RCC1 family protein
MFSDGALYAWGCNSYGQLGLGNQSGQQKPTLVSSLAGIPIAFIACGGNHSFAVSRSGKVNSHCLSMNHIFNCMTISQQVQDLIL